MATLMDNIRDFLEEKEVKYIYDTEKEVIIINFSLNVILLRLEENGEFLQLRTLNFYQYREGRYKLPILELIASVNYSRKLVKFGYDTEDGEINACIDIPIEDSHFTSSQFFRCLAALLESLDEVKNRIMAIIETGEDPGPNASRVVDLLVEEIMESMNEENRYEPGEDFSN